MGDAGDVAREAGSRITCIIRIEIQPIKSLKMKSTVAAPIRVFGPHGHLHPPARADGSHEDSIGSKACSRTNQDWLHSTQQRNLRCPVAMRTKRAPFFGWLGLKGNPYPKKGKQRHHRATEKNAQNGHKSQAPSPRSCPLALALSSEAAATLVFREMLIKSPKSPGSGETGLGRIEPNGGRIGRTGRMRRNPLGAELLGRNHEENRSVGTSLKLARPTHLKLIVSCFFFFFTKQKTRLDSPLDAWPLGFIEHVIACSKAMTFAAFLHGNVTSLRMLRSIVLQAAERICIHPKMVLSLRASPNYGIKVRHCRLGAVFARSWIRHPIQRVMLLEAVVFTTQPANQIGAGQVVQ